MFKRYDGFINNYPQKEIDEKLPICPFCGEPAHWLLEIHRGFSSFTTEFMCERCKARLMQESVGFFRLDTLLVTDIGNNNLARLQLNGAYHISALGSVARSLHNNRDGEVFNATASTGKEMETETNDVIGGQVQNTIYNGPPVAVSAPPNKSSAKVVVTIVSIAAILFSLLYILLTVVSCEAYGSLTYENYLKIHNGMTYSQVAEIFNSPGELTTSGGFEDYSLTYYTWQNSSGTKIVVVGFENNRVCAKSQIGLT